MISTRSITSGIICPHCSQYFQRKRDGKSHLRECMRRPFIAPQQPPEPARRRHSTLTLQPRSPSSPESLQNPFARKLSQHFCNLLDAHMVPESAISAVQNIAEMCVDTALNQIKAAIAIDDDVVSSARAIALPTKHFSSVKTLKRHLSDIAHSIVRIFRNRSFSFYSNSFASINLYMYTRNLRIVIGQQGGD